MQVTGGDNHSEYKMGHLPVENAYWDEVQRFIDKLNKQTGKKYRLPTEAEWEYAARGGNKSKGYKYSGSDNFDDVAWYGWDSDSYGNSIRRTQPVGTKLPNELGIYDMSGNVSEWVSDWYGKYSAEAKTDPQGPSSGSKRIARGGSWSSDTSQCTIYYRPDGVTPNDIRRNDYGFRLVLPP